MIFKNKIDTLSKVPGDWDCTKQRGKEYRHLRKEQEYEEQLHEKLLLKL